MKKCFSCLVLIIFVFASFFCHINFTQDKVYAETETPINQYAELSANYLNEFLSVEGTNYRLAGTDGEKRAGDFLINKMSSFTNFIPVNQSKQNQGFQSFSFISVLDNNKYSSRNIIFTKKGGSSEKKIVIACHYDSINYDVDSVTQGVNASAGSVATLLALADIINNSSVQLDFDVEIVFFGAGMHNYAGSLNYTLSISPEDSQNIILMINFDKLIAGDYLYSYSFETNNNMVNTISDIAKVESLKLNKYYTLGSVIESSNSPLGLNYTHNGLQSDNLYFSAINIPTLYFFSGYYEKSNSVGNKESILRPNITNTNKDTTEFIQKNCPDFANRLGGIVQLVSTYIYSDNFIHTSINKPLNNFFIDLRIPFFLIFAILIISWGIYKFIFIKSRTRAVIVTNNGSKIDDLFKKFTDELRNIKEKDNKQNIDTSEIEKYFKNDIKKNLKDDDKDKK